MLLFHFHQFNLKVQFFSSHLMVCVKCNSFFIFRVYLYWEWLTVLVGKIHLLTYSKVFRTWKLGDLHSKNRIWIRHAISFFRHQMNGNLPTHFHSCYCFIRTKDHLSGTAGKFQWFATVIGAVELRTIVKCSPVMCPADFSYIWSFK